MNIGHVGQYLLNIDIYDRLNVMSDISYVIISCTWEPAKLGWVVDFLLRFCLKIGCIFTFHEMRLVFLAEI